MVPGATNADRLVAAHYLNGHWIAENGSVLTPGNLVPSSVISKPLSVFGPFTSGYGGASDLQADTSVNLISGLIFKYYEGAFDKLPDFTTLTPVKTGSSPNIDLGIKRLGVNDSFAIVWEGHINIPAAGTYTFETVSDDGSKLYFNSLYSPNGTALIDNDGTRPSQSVSGTVNITAAGSYPIAITYFENYGGEGLQVFWTGPGIARQLIPDAAFGASARLAAAGLKFRTYDGGFNTLPDFSKLYARGQGTSRNVDLGAINHPKDSFAIVWEGYITLPKAGTYTFEKRNLPTRVREGKVYPLQQGKLLTLEKLN